MTTVEADQVISRAEARAARDPAFAELLALLVDTPMAGAGSYTRVAARHLNQQRRRAAVEAFKAAALPTADVQHLLGLGTPQAVHRLRSRGKIIGLPVGNATWFPAWQFAGGQLSNDLPRMLELLHRFSDDVVALDRVMRLRRDELGGASIAEALDRRRTAAAAWNVLAELAS